MSDKFGQISIESQLPSKKSTKKSRVKKGGSNKRQPSPIRNLSSRKLVLSFASLVVLVIYIGGGFIGVPYYLQNSIKEELKLAHNLDFSAKEIHFNPFSFRLVANQISLIDSEHRSVLEIESIDTRVSPIKLLRMEFIFPEVNLSKPSLHVIRNLDKSYNVESLLLQLREDVNDVEMMRFSDLPFLFSLNNITINDGSVTFTDKPAQKTHKVEEIELRLPTFSNTQYQANNYIEPYFFAHINGSPVTFTNIEQQDEDLTHLTWELRGFKLENYFNYLPTHLPLKTVSGDTSGTVTLQFNEKDSFNRLNILFDLELSQVAGESSENIIKLRTDKLKLKGGYNPITRTLTINELKAYQPRVGIQSGKVNDDLNKIFSTENHQVPGVNSSNNFENFILKSLEVQDGSLSIVPNKNSVEKQDWSALSVIIKNYHSNTEITAPNSSPIFAIEGKRSNNTFLFSYSGTFPSKNKSKGKLFIKSVPAKDLATYLISGINKTTIRGKGNLSGDLTLEWNKNQVIPSFFLENAQTTLVDLSVKDKKQHLFSTKKLLLSNSTITETNKSIGDVEITDGKLQVLRSDKNNVFVELISNNDTISSLRYHGDAAIVHSRNLSRPFTLKSVDINYQKSGLKHQPQQNITLSGVTSTGGEFEGKGKVEIKPFAIRLHIKFESIASKSTDSLFASPLIFGSIDGNLSGKGLLTLPKAAFAGDFKIIKGKIEHEENLSSWSMCSLHNVNFTSTPYHLGIESVIIKEPKLTTTVNKGDSSILDHLTNYIRQNLNDKVSGSNEKINISGTDIQSINLENGVVEITNQNLTPNKTSLITNLTGNITDIHSAASASNSSFNFSGLIDESTFSWSGTADLFQDNSTHSYSFIVTQYPLLNYKDQTNQILDLSVEKAFADLEYTIQHTGDESHRKLKTKLTALKPKSSNSSSALPLSMLKDSSDSIELIISRSSEDSEVPSFFDSISEELQKKLIKGSISPLLLAKGDFTDLIDNNFIQFHPGLFLLSDGGRSAMARYGALLLEHPHVKLRLSGGIAMDQDTFGLHSQLEEIEKERISKQNKKLYAIWLKKKQEFESQTNRAQDTTISEGNIAENDIPQKVLSGFRPLLPQPVNVDNEMLYDLAEKRLNIVKNQIMAQLSLNENRIEIATETIESLVESKENKGVHVQLLPYIPEALQ